MKTISPSRCERQMWCKSARKQRNGRVLKTWGERKRTAENVFGPRQQFRCQPLRPDFAAFCHACTMDPEGSQDTVQSTLRIARRVSAGLQITRVKLPGLRKTAVVIDGLFSPDEAAALLHESYQPCHGGYKRERRDVQAALFAGCCSAGASVVSTVLPPTVGSILWHRLQQHLPSRCVVLKCPVFYALRWAESAKPPGAVPHFAVIASATTCV